MIKQFQGANHTHLLPENTIEIQKKKHPNEIKTGKF